VAISWFYNQLETIFLLKITSISRSTRIKTIWDKDEGANMMEFAIISKARHVA
jgi:hypothetical protein